MSHGNRHHCSCVGREPALDRRRFLGLGLLGAGGLAAGSLSPWHLAMASGSVDALLLSCMDYRLVDDTVRYMDGRGMTNNYDHVVLAGASLGATTSAFPAWSTTFWEHLDTALKLHHVKKVIVMDHRDCGAYRVVLGRDFAADPVAERAVHAEQMTGLSKAIHARHRELAVELLLMNLDGSVEAIAA